MLGDSLMEKGLLTKAQLDKALAEQKNQPGEKLGAVLVKLGYVSKEQVEAAF